jgi:hypothetical protein
LAASLDNLSVAYFEPFLSSVISKSSGSLSGDLKLYGTFKELKLIGDNCMFKDFKFTVNFTQVPYILNGPVMVNENGIFSKDLYITDMRGYLADGGVIYFVVGIAPNGIERKIYYCELPPIKLRTKLANVGKQKTKNLKLKNLLLM